ncbi:hypothetical protein ACQP1P_23100 [Dactylosporangium sp. CA-052675]|uniref:hypothetical protein n=1 Tax=Dactylosporangium sp. CA-052675 TaxID=3239927 RepID=UPI003D92A5FD
MSAEQVLHVSTMPTGHRRTLAVTVGRTLTFWEKYTGDGSGWMGRITSLRAQARLDGPLGARTPDAGRRGPAVQTRRLGLVRRRLTRPVRRALES